MITIGTQLEVDILKRSGNEICNVIFEYSLNDWDNEKDFITRDEKEENEARFRFCRNKWHYRKYFCKRTYLKKMHEIYNDESSESESESDDEDEEMTARRARMLGNTTVYNKLQSTEVDMVKSNSTRSLSCRTASSNDLAHTASALGTGRHAHAVLKRCASLRSRKQRKVCSTNDLMSQLNSVSLDQKLNNESLDLEKRRERQASSIDAEPEQFSDTGVPARFPFAEEKSASKKEFFSAEETQSIGIERSAPEKYFVAREDSKSETTAMAKKSLSHRHIGNMDTPSQSASAMGLKINFKKVLSLEAVDNRSNPRLGGQRMQIGGVNRSLLGRDLLASATGDDNDSVNDMEDSQRNTIQLPAGLRTPKQPVAEPTQLLHTLFSFNDRSRKTGGEKETFRPALVRNLSNRSVQSSRNQNTPTTPTRPTLVRRLSDRSIRSSRNQEFKRSHSFRGLFPERSKVVSPKPLLTKRLSSKNLDVANEEHDGSKDVPSTPRLNRRPSRRKLSLGDNDTGSSRNCPETPKLGRRPSRRNLRLGRDEPDLSKENPTTPKIGKKSSRRNLRVGDDVQDSNKTNPKNGLMRRLSHRSLKNICNDGPVTPSLNMHSVKKSLSTHNLLDSVRTGTQPYAVAKRSLSSRDLRLKKSTSPRSGLVASIGRQVMRNASFQKNIAGQEENRQMSDTVDKLALARLSKMQVTGHKALELLMQDSDSGVYKLKTAYLAMALTKSGGGGGSGSSSLSHHDRHSDRCSGSPRPMTARVEVDGDQPGGEEIGKEEDKKIDHDKTSKADVDWKKKPNRCENKKRLEHTERLPDQSSAQGKKNYSKALRDVSAHHPPSRIDRKDIWKGEKSLSFKVEKDRKTRQRSAMRGSLHASMSALDLSDLEQGIDNNTKKDSNNKSEKHEKSGSHHSQSSHRSHHHSSSPHHSSQHGKRNNHHGSNHRSSSTHHGTPVVSSSHDHHSDKEGHQKANRDINHRHSSGSSFGSVSTDGRDKRRGHKKHRHSNGSHSSIGSGSSRHVSRHERKSSQRECTRSTREKALERIISNVGEDLNDGNHFWIKMIDQWVAQG